MFRFYFHRASLNLKRYHLPYGCLIQNGQYHSYMLESFLQEPERLTDDDVMLLLKLIFHRQDTQELLKKLLEREKPETP